MNRGIRLSQYTIYDTVSRYLSRTERYSMGKEETNDEIGRVILERRTMVKAVGITLLIPSAFAGSAVAEPTKEKKDKKEKTTKPSKKIK
jgi:hypothetical protein